MKSGKHDLQVVFVDLFLDDTGEFRINSVVASYECEGMNGIYTRHEQFDVDWCRRDSDYIWHWSGSGPAKPFEAHGFYWAADGIALKEIKAAWSDEKTRIRNPTARLAELPIDLGEYKDVLDYLESESGDTESYYCPTCKDHLPEESPCNHAWWCEEQAAMSVPGDRVKGCRYETCTFGRKWMREHNKRAKGDSL
jgi:hypothetical protein